MKEEIKQWLTHLADVCNTNEILLYNEKGVNGTFVVPTSYNTYQLGDTVFVVQPFNVIFFQHYMWNSYLNWIDNPLNSVNVLDETWGFDIEYDDRYLYEEVLSELQGEYRLHDEDSIYQIMRLGYNRQEAINMLDGFNADGSAVEILPF